MKEKVLDCGLWDSEGAEFAQEMMKEKFFSRDSEGAFGRESATPQTPQTP